MNNNLKKILTGAGSIAAMSGVIGGAAAITGENIATTATADIPLTVDDDNYRLTHVQSYSAQDNSYKGEGIFNRKPVTRFTYQVDNNAGSFQLATFDDDWHFDLFYPHTQTIVQNITVNIPDNNLVFGGEQTLNMKIGSSLAYNSKTKDHLQEKAMVLPWTGIHAFKSIELRITHTFDAYVEFLFSHTVKTTTHVELMGGMLRAPQ